MYGTTRPEEEEEEAGSVASDAPELVLAWRERLGVCKQCLLRDGPGCLAACVVLVWVIDGIASRYNLYAVLDLLRYGNYEYDR